MGVGEAALFKATSFDGRISVGDLNEPITFVAHAGNDHRLVVDPLNVAGSTYVALSKARGEPGGHGESINLTGTASDGTRFYSEHMEVRGSRSGTDGHQVQLTTGEASITLPRETTAGDDELGLRLSLRGFQSFRPNPVNAQLGRVTVQGAHKNVAPDDVSGTIVIQNNDGQPGEHWHEQALSLAKFIWSGLQFGHGGRLHVPLIEEFRSAEIVATFYSGSGRPAHLSSIHFLDQSEFIAALVARFESDDAFPDDVWQAVGWLNSDTTIDEIRYLTLMTAIETVLDSLVPDAPSTLIPKEKFKPIREALIQTLGEFDLSDEEKSVFEGSIKGINRAPISRKLKALIEKYGLSPSDFDDDMIRRLNKQRNSITHRGKALDGENLWDSILYARELIALIVFAELRYKGSYQRYAGGHEHRRLS